MILSFTAIDKSLEFREFCCQVPQLEMALDLLDKITAKGDVLLNVQLIDKEYCIELPAEAFDGEPIVEPVQKLEKQWQAILEEPVRIAASNQQLRIDLMRQQLDIYDHRIAQFIQVIESVELLRQRTESVLYYDVTKTKLTVRYDAILANYRQYITRALANRESMQQKLTQIEHSMID